VASVDSGEVDAELNEVKNKCKLVQRRLDRNSEPQASIESGSYTYQCAYHPYSTLPLM
jgi:vesicle transport protein SEC22